MTSTFTLRTYETLFSGYYTVRLEVKTMSNENPQGKSVSQADLLSPQERAVCEGVASGDAPHGQRALALLSLDEGVTQAEAAERAGLTAGQVQY
jgi:DNA-directed RNA polymerase specialized sigma24 family protein